MPANFADLDLSMLRFRKTDLRSNNVFASRLVLSDFRDASLQDANLQRRQHDRRQDDR